MVNKKFSAHGDVHAHFLQEKRILSISLSGPFNLEFILKYQRVVGAERENRKALAVLSAETFMPAVGINYDTGWFYDATELVNGRWLHHFYQGPSDTPTSHVWIDASQSIHN